MAEKTSLVAEVNTELNLQLADDNVKKALLATTFKGLEFNSMKQALMEGMIRGFTFEDFMVKNIYAIPFGGSYSLVTSIDHARKIGMRSGIVGKNAPVYDVHVDENTGKETIIISCTVTVKRKIDNYVGDFTATVFFSEYDKGSNLWKTKPRTMIAKVAEMHALRMACPEELSQSYIEDELVEDTKTKIEGVVGSSNLKMGAFLKNEKEDKGKKNKVENKETFSEEGERIIE